MLRRLPLTRVGAAAAAAGGYVASEYEAYTKIVEDARVEHHLPSPDDARLTEVVTVPRLLNDEEIAAVERLSSSKGSVMGSAGRNAANQAASYHTGVWETTYLSTGGVFAQELPEVRAKLIKAAADADERHWGILRCATMPVAPRCVEYHRVSPSGSLPFEGHHDAGSMLTIDVLLSDPAEFDGGAFVTTDTDGTQREHAFGRGDALIFLSHKPHSVMPVTAGERRVLVMELWEGEERKCGHRCERHWGPCNHTARASFWRRALQDIASDL